MGRRARARVRGQVIAQLRPADRGEHRDAGALVTREIGKPIAEARGEVQEISTPATSSSARAAGSTARPCPSEMPDKQLFTFRAPGRRRRRDHRRQLPGRGAVLVHRAGPALRQRGRLEAGRVLRRVASDAFVRALRARRRTRRGASTSCTPTDRTLRRSRRRRWTSGWSTRSGFTGSSDGRPADR